MQVYEQQHLTKEKLEARGQLLNEDQFKSIIKHLFSKATTACKDLQAAINDEVFSTNRKRFNQCLHDFQAYLLLQFVIFSGGQRAHQISQYCTGAGMQRTDIKNKDEFRVRGSLDSMRW